MTLKIPMIWIEGADEQLPLPSYATVGSAGADIRANFTEGERDGLTLRPGERALVPTGLAMEIPQGFEIQIRPRSGLALKQGLALVNAPGTIDADYRGPVGIIVINLGEDTIHIDHGQRIAQLVVAPVVYARFEIADALEGSTRGDGGFGSTGRS